MRVSELQDMLDQAAALTPTPSPGAWAEVARRTKKHRRRRRNASLLASLAGVAALVWAVSLITGAGPSQQITTQQRDSVATRPFILPDRELSAAPTSGDSPGQAPVAPSLVQTQNTPAALALVATARAGLGLSDSYPVYQATETTSIQAVSVVFRSPAGTIVVSQQPLSQPVPLSSVGVQDGSGKYEIDPAGNALAEEVAPTEVKISGATSAGSFLSVYAFGATEGGPPPVTASQAERFVTATLNLPSDLTVTSR